MQKVQLKYGEEHAKLLSQHHSIVQIMNAVMGGKSEGGSAPPGKDPNRIDLAAGHSDVHSAIAAINRGLRF